MVPLFFFFKGFLDRLACQLLPTILGPVIVIIEARNWIQNPSSLNCIDYREWICSHSNES